MYAPVILCSGVGYGAEYNNFGCVEVLRFVDEDGQPNIFFFGCQRKVLDELFEVRFKDEPERPEDLRPRVSPS
ncbi:hypothetical protein IG195_19805 (plasmid) [Arthrobacter sp. TES]|nr:hypothetical protein ARZXY2_4511 [Arthrobacter sp. ZXY-2]ERI35516.1 hypothetical protein M707_21415 [Arthrobacter sp. AK-YN10]QOI65638.1 hypothetical protein IG195_19805 [Arthrobacter sp. TES]